MIKLKSLLERYGTDMSLHNWLRGSKVVDEHDDPIIMYHAQKYKSDKLEPSRHDACAAQFVWFASQPLKEYGNYIYKAYLNIKNPIPDEKYHKIETWGGRNFGTEMKKMGYDGVLNIGKYDVIAAVLSSDQIWILGMNED